MKVVAKKEDNKPKQQPQSRPGIRVDERIMEPGKYEITKDSTFDIHIYCRKEGKRWVVTDTNDKKAEHEIVVMRMWTYDEMTDMKKKATAYDPIKKMHMIDTDALNQLKMQKLMVSWTFGKENPNLQLYHSNGVLVDEAWARVKKLFPTILNHLIDQMNSVYEYNG